MKNPVLNGFYADPDIRVFEGRYYLYPTTDGNHWKGTSFRCFSSADLKEWTDHGVVFDITWDSSWATDFAWAPSAACKNGKYYLYYCANQKIGAAVSDTPWGPFENLSKDKPLLSMENLEPGVHLDQVIDPYIYTAENGHNYLYFGNGISPAVVELEEDMVTLIPQTMKNIVFERDADFREAFMGFYEQGRYHFTWSCDDTRSEDYHVKYGVSDNPTGPVHVCGTILEKEPEKNILGTGHHSMIKDPLSGKYYIAYHRFAYPDPPGVDGWERGYHRVTCIEEMDLDENGLFQKVKFREE